MLVETLQPQNLGQTRRSGCVIFAVEVVEELPQVTPFLSLYDVQDALPLLDLENDEDVSQQAQGCV